MTKISETTRPEKILPISEEDLLSIPTKAKININYDDVYFDEEFNYDSTSQIVKEMNKEIASQSVKIEGISNSSSNLAPTPQMTLAKADNYDDMYFDKEDLKEKKIEINKVKSDDENNSEEEMPDESDNNRYSGCGGYNEYGKSDR
ncbi:35614_t:CDS:2, partial [Racocetra persica]